MIESMVAEVRTISYKIFLHGDISVSKEKNYYTLFVQCIFYLYIQ
jgi:hypothetical protein